MTAVRQLGLALATIATAVTTLGTASATVHLDNATVEAWWLGNAVTGVIADAHGGGVVYFWPQPAIGFDSAGANQCNYTLAPWSKILFQQLPASWNGSSAESLLAPWSAALAADGGASRGIWSLPLSPPRQLIFWPTQATVVGGSLILVGGAERLTLPPDSPLWAHCTSQSAWSWQPDLINTTCILIHNATHIINMTTGAWAMWCGADAAPVVAADGHVAESPATAVAATSVTVGFPWYDVWLYPPCPNLGMFARTLQLTHDSWTGDVIASGGMICTGNTTCDDPDNVARVWRLSLQPGQPMRWTYQRAASPANAPCLFFDARMFVSLSVAAINPYRHELLLFSGMAPGQSTSSLTCFVFDMDARLWSQPPLCAASLGPFARSYATWWNMVGDDANGVGAALYVFGGMYASPGGNTDTYFADAGVWRLDWASYQWGIVSEYAVSADVAAPAALWPRFAHSAVHVPWLRSVAIYGGILVNPISRPPVSYAYLALNCDCYFLFNSQALPSTPGSLCNAAGWMVAADPDNATTLWLPPPSPSVAAARGLAAWPGGVAVAGLAMAAWAAALVAALAGFAVSLRQLRKQGDLDLRRLDARDRELHERLMARDGGGSSEGDAASHDADASLTTLSEAVTSLAPSSLSVQRLHDGAAVQSGVVPLRQLRVMGAPPRADLDDSGSGSGSGSGSSGGRALMAEGRHGAGYDADIQLMEVDRIRRHRAAEIRDSTDADGEAPRGALAVPGMRDASGSGTGSAASSSQPEDAVSGLFGAPMRRRLASASMPTDDGMLAPPPANAATVSFAAAAAAPAMARDEVAAASPWWRMITSSLAQALPRHGAAMGLHAGTSLVHCAAAYVAMRGGYTVAVRVLQCAAAAAQVGALAVALAALSGSALRCCQWCTSPRSMPEVGSTIAQAPTVGRWPPWMSAALSSAALLLPQVVVVVLTEQCAALSATPGRTTSEPWAGCNATRAWLPVVIIVTAVGLAIVMALRWSFAQADGGAKRRWGRARLDSVDARQLVPSYDAPAGGDGARAALAGEVVGGTERVAVAAAAADSLPERLTAGDRAAAPLPAAAVVPARIRRFGELRESLPGAGGSAALDDDDDDVAVSALFAAAGAAQFGQ